MNNIVDSLIIGNNKYTKIKYSSIQMAEVASIYINYYVSKDFEAIDKMFQNALLKISVNDKQLNSIVALNNHFTTFKNELREVRTWSLLEGLQPFLASFSEKPDLEINYFNSSQE
jgi:hypothetical protein